MLVILNVEHSSDTDRSDIIAPIPRKHLTIQRNESQHWLGSPPLSPVSTISRAISPLQNLNVENLKPRARHTRSFSSLFDHEKRQSTTLQSPSMPQTRQLGQEYPDDTSSPARRWTRWMHKQGLKPLAVPIILLISALIRWCIGLASYSGQ